jgi:hypothetical protein
MAIGMGIVAQKLGFVDAQMRERVAIDWHILVPGRRKVLHWDLAPFWKGFDQFCSKSINTSSG